MYVAKGLRVRFEVDITGPKQPVFGAPSRDCFRRGGFGLRLCMFRANNLQPRAEAVLLHALFVVFVRARGCLDDETRVLTTAIKKPSGAIAEHRGRFRPPTGPSDGSRISSTIGLVQIPQNRQDSMRC